jgi:hypothetical protein
VDDEELGMVKNLSRDSQKEDTRKFVLVASAIAALMFVGSIAVFAVPHLFDTTDYLGRPQTGADKRTATTTIGTGVPTQGEAQSTVAKNDSGGAEDPTGGRARNIKQSSQPVSLSHEQRDKLRAILASAGGPRVDRPNFEMMIGTSVPRQTESADLPGRRYSCLAVLTAPGI